MKNQTGGKIQLVRPNQSSSECIGGGNPIKTAEDVCGPCVGIFFANYAGKNCQQPKFCTSFVLFTAEKNPSSRERSKQNAKIVWHTILIS